MRTRHIIAAILGLGLLAGCNAEERGHVVKLDKGGYAGAPDNVLPDATRLTLRNRAMGQSDGAADIAVGDGPEPDGATPASGRISGQNY